MKTFVLDEREGVAGEFEVAEGGWVKLNAEQVGFFRINYPPQMWTALEEGVAAGEVGVLDRLGEGAEGWGVRVMSWGSV